MLQMKNALSIKTSSQCISYLIDKIYIYTVSKNAPFYFFGNNFVNLSPIMIILHNCTPVNLELNDIKIINLS